MALALSNFVTQLPHFGAISLSGEQRNQYLQGQVTIDVDKITPTSARRGCQCDFKGKAWSSFVAVDVQQQLLLLTAKSSLPKSLSELNKYGVFSKVDIIDASDTFFSYGFVGDETIALLSNIFQELPANDLDVVQTELGSVICMNAANSTFWVVVNVNQQQQFVELLEDTTLHPSELWDATMIQLGLAHISEATANEFVPQMLNMQALDAIDFDKGCYMGQEVVARTKFLGKNKRATFILMAPNAHATEMVDAGAMLEKKAGDNWRSGGTIINSAVVSSSRTNLVTDDLKQDQTWALAVLANDTQSGDVLRLKANPEIELVVQDLPYSITD